MSDVANRNSKIGQSADRASADSQGASDSPVGAAISSAGTAMGAYGTVMSSTGHLTEAAVVPVLKKLSFMQGIACLPASAHLDPVLGIDVHFVIIPPSPAPIPMPHPFIAIILDPRDWISIAVMSVAAMAAPVPTDGGDGDAAASLAFSAATMVLALLGMGATVKVGSFQPRTVTGVSNTVIPHFPMGASFAPVPVLKNSGHAQFGSLFLSADGNPFSGLLHLNNDCWDIGIMQLMRRQYKTEPMHLFLPTGFIMAIPAHNVIVNPIPTPINPITALTNLFNFGIAKLLHGLTSRLPIGSRLSNMLNKSICHVTGHPVDVASGTLFTDEEDFNLPGMVPLSWDRTWYSDSVYKGPLGHGWHHGYDMGFFIDELGQGIVRLKDGRLAGFELPKPGGSSYNRYEQLTLHCHPEEKFYYLTDAEGLIYRFTGRKYGEREECFLQSIANANGYAIRLEYDRRGCLVQIVDSAARVLTVENDREGRIVRIFAPHPEEVGKDIAVASYVYSEEGDLVSQVDALGQEMSYAYEEHLLKQEVWRDGQRWYFIYDGASTGARCIHTWGDGGLYDHQLTYLEGQTLVENSLGYVTTYHIRDGLLESRVDPSGAVWEYRYNRWHELEWTTDPLGNQQGYTHDEKGNIATTTDAGGGFTYREYYDPRWPHLPTEGLDAAGGKWNWLYDRQGNLLEEKDPLGAITEYEYNDGLLAVIARGGAKTLFEYDDHRNLTSVRASDGGTTSYSYDRLGNCVKVVNPNGRSQRCKYDWKGRVVRMEDFDGNVIESEYDGLDNLVRRRDLQRDIRYTYRGLWNMTSKSEAGSTIHFHYDTEEQLRKVVNEHGQTYVLLPDSSGRVIRETGFDGISRRYERNAAGWVTKVHRPGDKFTTYGYDACGRCIRVGYTDGSTEEYAFRPDGEMIRAANEETNVAFNLDVCGNVLSESSGAHWVRSEYDRLGQRVRTTSSLGAAIDRGYDALGDMRQLGGDGWLVSLDYDQLGLEVSRQLPGGIQRQWQRDGVGRPVALRVGSGKTRTYAWDVNTRLQQIRDGQALTRMIHDGRGRLSETIFPEGEVQLRNPDAIGNLFRSSDRKDRVFGKGGRLKKAGGWEYIYDEEGRLISKEHADGKVWSYIWNEAGRLVSVVRPDGNAVSFGYDALGRRLWKKYHNTITNFIWDGERLLHEWKEGKDVITWLFDEQSFSPAAKLKGDKQYSIVTDHLGVPLQMYRADGQLFWEGELDSYGGMRMEKGETGSCPFRYPGQYADAETGLYYNLNRYYAPEEGFYIQQDPIGLHSGELNLYAYVGDPMIWMDELGLGKSHYNGNRGETRAEQDLKRNGFKKVRSQVSMTVNGHNIRADFVAEDGHGNLHVFESKFGSGRLTPNQRATKLFNTRNPANTCRKGGGTILTGNGRVGSFVENGSAPKPATFHVLKYR